MSLAVIEKELGDTSYQTHNLPSPERLNHDAAFVETAEERGYEDAKGEVQVIKTKRVRMDSDMGRKLLQRRVISGDQYATGRNYASLAYISRGSLIKSPLASMGAVSGGYSDSARDALSELLKLQLFLKPRERLLIEAVFCNDISLTQIERDLSLRRGEAKIILIMALDTLA